MNILQVLHETKYNSVAYYNNCAVVVVRYAVFCGVRYTPHAVGTCWHDGKSCIVRYCTRKQSKKTMLHLVNSITQQQKTASPRPCFLKAVFSKKRKHTQRKTCVFSHAYARLHNVTCTVAKVRADARARRARKCSTASASPPYTSTAVVMMSKQQEYCRSS